MTKKRKLLILSLFLCLSTTMVFGTESNAEGTSGEQTSAVSGMKDENAQRLEKVTGMDESGNVFEVDDSDGTFENGGNAQYFRSASNELVVNFNTKGNAVTNYTEAASGNAGYTNGAYGADGAYLGMENGKVKFMMSGVIGLVSASEVQVVRLSDTAVVSGYYVSGGRLIHGVVGDMTTPGYASRLDNGPAPSYLSGGTTYYSYDGHYFYTNYGTMITDYQKNTRSHSVNANNPYYNYFQYLPLRSKTGYSAAQLSSAINGKATNSSSKMRNTGTQFVNQQNTYGINALVMAGIAANESGWGISSICQSKNNLFGLNAVDSSPGTSADKYASVDECIRQFANGWMSRGYVYPNDSRYRGGFLGNKGSGMNVKYASDPFWGEKAAAVMYTLDASGGGKDSGRYTIGIKDTLYGSGNNVNVRSSNSTSSTALYKTGIYTSYAVLLKESQAAGSFYKIQSDAVLNSGRTAVSAGVGEYNFDNMYAFISSDYVTVVNKGSDTAVPKTLSSISISTPPAKTVYTEGEKFDATGMVVKAKWSDGTESDVTKNITFPKEALAKGTASVTIQYTADQVTKTAAQKITVNEKTTVTEVSINPASVEMKTGSSRTFGVAVAGTGNPAQTVTWSVTGAKSADTKIDSTGKLQIGTDETAESLTVRAATTVDTSKYAEATVKVLKDEVSGPDTETPDVDVPDNGQPDNSKPDADIPDADAPDGDGPEAEPGPDSSQNNGSGNDADNTVEVKNEQNGIKVSGTIPADASLKVEVIDKGSDNYSTLTEPVKTHTILGVYDISLDKDLGKDEVVQLGFNVDTEHNGKEAVVLHYAEKDGRTYLETYHATVTDGTVTIEVTGFSPYVIALNDAGANTIDDGNQQGPSDSGPDNDVLPPDIDGGVQDGSNNLLGSSNPSSGTVSTPPAGSPEGSGPVSGQNGGSPSTQSSDADAKAASGETVDKTSKASAQVKVSDKEDKTKASKTADESRIVIWGLLLLLSALAAAFAIRFRKLIKK
ncbi:glucosaminidase domain-containing protein [Dorea sp. D27]|uniref:glucosaminidase domain-containing protein n=1 Tax=Dorea sp. D27 TaxID=658665 RepID=UPI0006739264|nr:glucosaminidase domain-containing protein [Dorea sp. D27]